MAGRKTLCTPELTQEIAGYIAQGLSNRDAAALAGLDESTFYKWLARGRAELERVRGGSGRRKVRKREAPFVAFVAAIKKAIPRRKQTLVAKIQAAADESWQAAAWLLERLHPEEFARRDRLTIDWRSEAEAVGLDAGELFEQMVQQLAARMVDGE